METLPPNDRRGVTNGEPDPHSLYLARTSSRGSTPRPGLVGTSIHPPTWANGSSMSSCCIGLMSGFSSWRRQRGVIADSAIDAAVLTALDQACELNQTSLASTYSITLRTPVMPSARPTSHPTPSTLPASINSSNPPPAPPPPPPPSTL